MPFGSIARLSAKRKFKIGKRQEIMLCSANRHTRSSNAIELEEDSERAKFQSMSMHPDPVYHDSSEYSLQKFDNVRERSEVGTLILNPKVKCTIVYRKCIQKKKFKIRYDEEGNEIPRTRRKKPPLDHNEQKKFAKEIKPKRPVSGKQAARLLRKRGLSPPALSEDIKKKREAKKKKQRIEDGGTISD